MNEGPYKIEYDNGRPFVSGPGVWTTAPRGDDADEYLDALNAAHKAGVEYAIAEVRKHLASEHNPHRMFPRDDEMVKCPACLAHDMLTVMRAHIQSKSSPVV